MLCDLNKFCIVAKFKEEFQASFKEFNDFISNLSSSQETLKFKS